MKKLIVLFSLLFVSLNSQAYVLLSEPFSEFSVGSAILNPPGLWINTSGLDGDISGSAAHPYTIIVTNEVVTNYSGVVTNNAALVYINAQEDDRIVINGSPYDPTNRPDVPVIYFSFTINCQVLPNAGGEFAPFGPASTGPGDYFVHFTDSTTSDFHCRVFARTTNAAPGCYRLGISMTNSWPDSGPSYILNGTNFTPGYSELAMDLQTNVQYTVAIRFIIADNDVVMWVNQNPLLMSESDPNFTEDTESQALVWAVNAVCFRECSSSTYIPGTMLIGNILVGTTFADVAGDNQPPTVTQIAHQYIPANTNTGPISFQVNDVITPAGLIAVSATSSNTVIVPNANIVLGGSGANRTVTVTPAASQQGTVIIALTVTDTNNNSTISQFAVTVGAPSISAIGPQSVYEGGTTTPISFTVSDHESPASSLTVAGYSSNTNLVPTNDMVFGGSGSNRTLTITPTNGLTGESTISVVVSDGINFTTNSFSFTVAPSLGILFADQFGEYPSGTILYLGSDNNGNTSPWEEHSGTPGQLSVTNGLAVISESNTEDLNATLDYSPFYASNGTIIYYGCSVQLTTLPGLTGDYFMHLMDTSTDFRGKLFACETNAAHGLFRFGISNGANAPPNVQWPEDMVLSNTYNVVVRYNTATATTTLWVNPTKESDPSVTAADPQVTEEVDWISMRENTFEGVEWIGNLVVSTSFQDVIPPTLSFLVTNSNLQVSWLTNYASYNLQTNSVVDTSIAWQNVTGTPATVGNQLVLDFPLSASSSTYFRLQRPAPNAQSY